MGAKLYLGNGQATPSVVIEKEVQPVYARPIRIDENGVVTADGTKLPDLSNTTAINVFGYYESAYSRNNTFSGKLDLSSWKHLNGAGSTFRYMFYNCQNITSIDLSNIKEMKGTADYTHADMFSNCSNLEEVDMQNLEVVDAPESSFLFAYCNKLRSINLDKLKFIAPTYNRSQYWFRGCTSLTAMSFPSLLQASYLNYMFVDCTNLESATFPKLYSIAYNGGWYGVFQNCSKLKTVDFSNLISLNKNDNYGDRTLLQTFINCTALTTISFPKLNFIGDSEAFYETFKGCTSLKDIYLPAITEASFTGGYKSQTYNNQLKSMLAGVTGCTVHFPVNLDPQTGCTTISSLAGYPNFGGTNTVLEFDQPEYTNVGNFDNIPEIYIGGLRYVFGNRKDLVTVTFSILESINREGLLGGFQNCINLKNIYFPALKIDSFIDGKNGKHLQNMLYGVTGCTLHFPSNLSNLIPTFNYTNGYPNFGGTNTTVLYDLPATE